MNRLELLHLVIGRARSNGFELRRWYTARLGLPWVSLEHALTLLDSQRRYYALVFSHEFAQTFWKPGTDITFDVPSKAFQRIMPDGTIRTVQRKPFIRRSARPNAWKYHLRQMALAEEPLRYLRKYLHIEGNLTLEAHACSEDPQSQKTRTKTAHKKQSASRPLPTDPPAFLKRPYKAG